MNAELNGGGMARGMQGKDQRKGNPMKIDLKLKGPARQLAGGDSSGRRGDAFIPALVLSALTAWLAACSNSEGPEGSDAPEPFSVGKGDVEAVAVEDDPRDSERVLLSVTLDSEASKAFEAFTKANVGKEVEIVVARDVIANPQIGAPIPGGRFQARFESEEEARAVAAKLQE